MARICVFLRPTAFGKTAFRNCRSISVPGDSFGGCAKGAEKASCGETVVQNAKMDSTIFSMNSEVFKSCKSKS